MNKKMKLVGSLILTGCILASPAMADQDYRHRNGFNHFTDWCATMWKGPEEKQRIVNERVELRAQWRQSHEHHQDHDDHDRGDHR